MNRRGFLAACLASATAPYVSTMAGVLMPVRAIAVPVWPDIINQLRPCYTDFAALTDAQRRYWSMRLYDEVSRTPSWFIIKP